MPERITLEIFEVPNWELGSHSISLEVDGVIYCPASIYKIDGGNRVDSPAFTSSHREHEAYYRMAVATLRMFAEIEKLVEDDNGPQTRPLD
jgi:hypothetical protein